MFEMRFVALQKQNFFGHTSRKMGFFNFQRESYAPDAWKCIEDTDSRFCRQIEKSFSARRVYPNTLFSGNTRSHKFSYYCYCYPDNQWKKCYTS